jgi:hypothetical protein
MVRSAAPTVAAYLKGLPEHRRAVVSAVRDVMLRYLPEGYREAMNWGMISYEIPLERYPNTYNGQPLMYAGLAAQKNYYALYLNCAYQDSTQGRRLKDGFKRAGKKLDMGKACVRFRELEDLPLDVVGRIVGSTSPERFIARYEDVRNQLPRTRKSSRAR